MSYRQCQDILDEIEAKRLEAEETRLRNRKEVADLGRFSAIVVLVGFLIIIGGIAWDMNSPTLATGVLSVIIGCIMVLAWTTEAGFD